MVKCLTTTFENTMEFLDRMQFRVSNKDIKESFLMRGRRMLGFEAVLFISFGYLLLKIFFGF